MVPSVSAANITDPRRNNGCDRSTDRGSALLPNPPAPNATLTTALQAAQAQAAASPWQEYRTGDGAVAYYNPTTGETAWTKPVSACD